MDGYPIACVRQDCFAAFGNILRYAAPVYDSAQRSVIFGNLVSILIKKLQIFC